MLQEHSAVFATMVDPNGPIFNLMEGIIELYNMAFDYFDRKYVKG